MKFMEDKNLLFEKMKQQLSKWFEAREVHLISNDDVYRFLLSIKEYADSFHLSGLYQISSSLLERIKSRSELQWEKEDLKDFLHDLISLTSEYETFNEVEEHGEYTRDEKIPVIQIIDDDISMLILLKDILEEKGWMVIANTSPEKAISQYYDVNPDCVIIDMHLTNKSGIKILEDLQRHTRKMFVPKIIISTLNDRNTRLNAFRKGADDFFVKPIDFEELILRIERHLQRKQFYDQSVLFDELTNLYNRRFLKDEFSRISNDLKRYGYTFSIAMLDLDHFKEVNDCYGHLVGDHVLSSLASLLKANTRPSDTVFRYGGEEFVILFPHTNLHQAMEVVSRLLDDFSKKKFMVGDREFSLTFSGGVHTITVEESLEAALNAADQALYKAKELGRARIESTNHSLPEYQKRKLFISVIDDDPIIRTMLTKILQSMVIEQYSVDLKVFEDGIKFLDSKRLAEHGEHFLILDGVMPVMDGLEILQKVRQQKYPHNILVLMLTGRKNETDIAQALKYGADDYITKPFSISELQERIKRLINRKIH